jgi:uncharacterized protein (TIGR00369 family)
MLQPAPDAAAPSGFRALPIRHGFVAANGPLYGRREGDGAPVLGFRVDERHLNLRGICHGGMLMTFADMVLGFTAAHAVGGRRFLPTVNMTADFIGSVEAGAWVEGRGRALRITRNLAFVEVWLSVGEAVVLRANGILKVPAAESGDTDILAMFG